MRTVSHLRSTIGHNIKSDPSGSGNLGDTQGAFPNGDVADDGNNMSTRSEGTSACPRKGTDMADNDEAARAGWESIARELTREGLHDPTRPAGSRAVLLHELDDVQLEIFIRYWTRTVALIEATDGLGSWRTARYESAQRRLARGRAMQDRLRRSPWCNPTVWDRRADRVQSAGFYKAAHAAAREHAEGLGLYDPIPDQVGVVQRNLRDLSDEELLIFRNYWRAYWKFLAQYRVLERRTGQLPYHVSKLASAANIEMARRRGEDVGESCVTIATRI